MTNTPTSTLPALGGISLKPVHYEEILEHNPNIGFLEIHPENYMVKGGLQHFYLEKIRERYPLSMHGVGMSLGSASGISGNHLDELALLVDRYSPNAVSEHLAWSHGEEVFTNDLLPLPYTEESLKLVSTNIDIVQTKLKRKILIENPSTYIEFNQSEMAETEFLTALVKKTGCGLLLDINNTYVNCRNHNRDPKEYIDNYPLEEIGEIHLAGHSIFELSDEKIICIDDHGSKVSKDVWALFQYTLENLTSAKPLLIEWDTHIPDLSILVSEMELAEEYQAEVFS